MIAPTYIYRAKTARVIDGDSLECLVDLGFRTFSLVLIRLRGVWCPELREPGGQEAREFVARLLAPTPYIEERPPVVVQSFRDRRSFARWVADVYIEGESVADLIIKAGHGTATR